MAGVFFWFYFVVTGVCTVSCFSSGPPINRPSVCEMGIPDSTSVHTLGAGNGGFTISTDLDFNMVAGMYSFTSAQRYTGQYLPRVG